MLYYSQGEQNLSHTELNNLNNLTPRHPNNVQKSKYLSNLKYNSNRNKDEKLS